jgi:hypothetical protein
LSEVWLLNFLPQIALMGAITRLTRMQPSGKCTIQFEHLENPDRMLWCIRSIDNSLFLLVLAEKLPRISRNGQSREPVIRVNVQSRQSWTWKASCAIVRKMNCLVWPPKWPTTTPEPQGQTNEQIFN